MLELQGRIVAYLIENKMPPIDLGGFNFLLLNLDEFDSVSV